HVKIQEVHDAEHHQDGADLVANQLDRLAEGFGRHAGAQGQGDVSQVDQVEPDHQQVIDGIGQFGVALESVHQEHPPVLAERSGHPYGNRQTDSQIQNVDVDDKHPRPPLEHVQFERVQLELSRGSWGVSIGKL